MAEGGNKGGGTGTIQRPGSKSKEKHETKVPKKYRVILHNDDFTTMEFVVWVLMAVFRHDALKAEQITMRVHKTGKGVAGVYSREIAETKVARTLEAARGQGHPLEVTMEPE